jgi:beta-phosphoglucomutase family hydrolase
LKINGLIDLLKYGEDLKDMSKISALLFDMDGTLVDNMAVHVQSWVEYFLSLGVKDSAENVYIKVAGKTSEEVIRLYLGEDLPQSKVLEHYDHKENLYRKLYQPIIKEIPGVSSLLKQAKQMGLSMAIASAAGIDNIEFTLNNLEISGYFKTIVCAHDIKNSKPDPEIFLLAAERLGVNPDDCLVFEDALVGVEGAHRAGMKAVAITTGYPVEKFAQYPAVIKVVDNYLDLNLQELVEQVMA